MENQPDGQRETATLGGGCFWCLEAVFDRLEGVLSVESGYMGGEVDHPSYEAVCGGATGHAEVIQVTFDPARVSYATLLDLFFTIHDPTTLNRQGNDAGTQYRSVIFTHSSGQERIARAVIAALETADPVVTQVLPAERFWIAEPYHQEYFAHHPNQSYCVFVVRPKVEKFEHWKERQGTITE